MPKAEKQKQKLLYILKMLHEKSDESHPIRMDAIIAMLDREGIKAERKSIYNDMDTLRDFGYDIVLTKGKNGGYFLASREFEAAELKVLVDAVQASRFITAKKSNELIGKLTKLACEQEAKHLKREVYVVNRVKSDNESIFYNVDDIYRAMEQNQQIAFQYMDYSLKKEVHYRRNGKVYQVSPWALTWNEEKYYLIAYDEEAKALKHYRVDKIKNISILKDNRVIDAENKNFNVAEYCNRFFGMYSGISEIVTVRFPNELMSVVVDRFGKDITVHAKEDNSFTIRINVAVSPQLFGWLTGLGPEVQIVSPGAVVEEYRKYLKSILNQYES